MRCVSCNSGDGSSFSALSALSIKMNSLSSLPHVSLPDSLPYSNFLQTSIVLSPSVLRHKKKKPVVFLPYVVGIYPQHLRIPSQSKNGSTVCELRADLIGLSVPKTTSDSLSTMAARTQTTKGCMFHSDSQMPLTN